MSSQRSTTTTALVIIGAAVLGSLVVYAGYFDYKRRNDIQFRKQLRKEHKRVKRAKAETAQAAATSTAQTDAELQAALERIRNEPLPTTNQEREQYFTKHVADGEMMSVQGPAFHFEAALSFYRGLRVYPVPVELIMIYQKTLPPPIFDILMKLTSLDVKSRGEGYYEHFPPSSMNVAVKQVASVDTQGNRVVKNVMVATKDFSVGDVIYTELPMSAALDGDLEGSGKYCSQCLRKLSAPAVRLSDDPLDSVYCSSDCRDLAGNQHHNFLFGLGTLVSVDPNPPPAEPRRAAQREFAAMLKTTGHSRPLLTIRLFAHEVMTQAAKMMPMLKPDAPLPPASVLPEPQGAAASEYTFADHVERLRFLELQAPPEELAAMRKLFATALDSQEPGDFMTDERYTTLKGKVGYNAIGVVFDNGRTDRKSKVPKDLATDDDGFEWTRTPFGTDLQVGSALYRVSSYLGHSCTPSVRPMFPKGTYELHLVASRSIAKGEELTMAYVDVARQPGESAQKCMMRRCSQLAAGWRFLCRCARCVEESPKRREDLPAGVTDGSKVDDVVRRFEEATAAA